MNLKFIQQNSIKRSQMKVLGRNKQCIKCFSVFLSYTPFICQWGA